MTSKKKRNENKQASKQTNKIQVSRRVQVTESYKQLWGLSQVFLHLNLIQTPNESDCYLDYRFIRDFEAMSYMLSHFTCVRLFVTPWTVACQATLSMRLSRQEYWNGLPFCPPGDLPGPGIKPTSLTSPALAGGSLPIEPPRKPRDSWLTEI